MERPFDIGRIVNTQGIKGEVRVVPTTDDINRFKDLEYVMIDDKEEKNKKLNIETVRYHKNFILIKFKDLNSINDVEYLKGKVIKVPYEMGIPLEEDEYYYRDLYDLNVYTDENEFLGNITDIIETGANDVYVVSKEEQNDLLIPAIKQCILEIDIDNKKMIVHIMEGLR